MFHTHSTKNVLNILCYGDLCMKGGGVSLCKQIVCEVQG